MNKVIAGFVAALSIASVACSGGGSDEPAPTMAQASALSIVDACSANVLCAYGDTVGRARLLRDPNGCQVGDFILQTNGSVLNDDDLGLTWTSSAVSFSMCAKDECIVCVPEVSSASPAPAKSGGRCKGDSASCYNLPPGSCSHQDGCSMRSRQRVAANGNVTVEYACEGTANACEDYDSESSCTGQGGCRWE